jgi:AbrB family looped-hinge helix DNA binding protein
MDVVSTTRMSSKGQVVIPENVRNRLKLEPGAQFVVVGNDDAVILKMITPPSMNEFDELICRARKQARASGLTRGSIAKAIVRVRGRR